MYIYSYFSFVLRSSRFVLSCVETVHILQTFCLFMRSSYNILQGNVGRRMKLVQSIDFRAIHMMSHAHLVVRTCSDAFSLHPLSYSLYLHGVSLAKVIYFNVLLFLLFDLSFSYGIAILWFVGLRISFLLMIGELASFKILGFHPITPYQLLYNRYPSVETIHF